MCSLSASAFYKLTLKSTETKIRMENGNRSRSYSNTFVIHKNIHSFLLMNRSMYTFLMEKIRKKTLKIGYHPMPFGKHRMHSLSGRHYDDRKWRFTEGIERFFIISNLYRVITGFAEVHTDITWSFKKSNTHITLKEAQCKKRRHRSKFAFRSPLTRVCGVCCSGTSRLVPIMSIYFVEFPSQWIIDWL